MKVSRIVVAALLASSMTVLAQAPPGSIPAKTGHTSFKFGDAEFTYDKVQGTFQQSYGFTVITINFSKDERPGSDHLGISLMIQKAGPVNLNQPMGNGIGYWKGGNIYSYVKGKSQCTMTVTNLTSTSVEGVAECPVINDTFGSGTSSLTAVKFSASTN
jgi:hypothetical protein